MKNLKTRNTFVVFAVLSLFALAGLGGAFGGWVASASNIKDFGDSFANLFNNFGIQNTIMMIFSVVILAIAVLCIVFACKMMKNVKGAKVVSILLSCALVVPALVILYQTKAGDQVLNFISWVRQPVGTDPFSRAKIMLIFAIMAAAVMSVLFVGATVISGAFYAFTVTDVELRRERDMAIAAEKAEVAKLQEIRAEQENIVDVVRKVIREELAALQQGPTFTSPLVVQYFNQSEGEAPAQVAAPAEEVKEVVAPVEEVKEEPVVEEAPAVEAVAKAPIIRVPFDERIAKAEKDIQEKYNEIKNEILSYGVKSRVSSTGDTFRLHRKTYVKITVAGKGLKLYYALNPEDYKDSTIPVGDASEKGIYEDIPLVFKVKSDLSVRRAKQLVKDLCEKDGLTQGEVPTENHAKALRADVRARKAAAKEANK